MYWVIARESIERRLQRVGTTRPFSATLSHATGTVDALHWRITGS
jgi:hypothetical protein